MEKLYFKCTHKNDNQTPTEETVNFILNYSKALSVIDCPKMKFEVLLN